MAALRLGVLVALFAMTGLGGPRLAQAQIGSERYAAIVTEAGTGNVLVAANEDELRHPASLTKMMTLYMTFEALRDGRLTLNTIMPVTWNAADQPPSRLGLVNGMSLTVEDAILAMVTKSANDAAAAMGEYLGEGSEDRFAQMMTLRARALGMTRTVFRNASGLPDTEQVTTARDMALLGRRLVHDFPDRFAYFATPHFRWRGRTMFNHNRLLQEYDGADGIKTGYVNDSGFNLVASAKRDGVRLVAAVFGGRTGRERDRHIMALLDQGFAQMGVATRTVTARRNLPTALPGAMAATPPGPQRVAQRRPGKGGPLVVLAPAPRPLVAGRPASMRLANDRHGSDRHGARGRVEQGDTARNSVPAAPQRARATVQANRTARRS